MASWSPVLGPSVEKVRKELVTLVGGTSAEECRGVVWLLLGTPYLGAIGQLGVWHRQRWHLRLGLSGGFRISSSRGD